MWTEFRIFLFLGMLKRKFWALAQTYINNNTQSNNNNHASIWNKAAATAAAAAVPPPLDDGV